MNCTTRNTVAITGYISDSGTIFAGPTGGLGNLLRRAFIAAIALPLTGAALPPPSTAELTVHFEGLRNDHGALHVCLTGRQAEFLDCDEDPAARRKTLPAAKAHPVTFREVEPGAYYLLVLHDENGNGKLDTTLGIPREGFGFSGNPGLRMGPPRAGKVRFDVDGPRDEQRVKLRYLL